MTDECKAVSSAPEFRAIDVERDFERCVAFRKDAWRCSFQTDTGFSDAIVGYRERILTRQGDERWFYRHIWLGEELIGQLEFRSFSEQAGTGYVHLFYLRPEYRGMGLAGTLQDYVARALISAGCHCADLSVSRTNVAAIQHYTKWDWQYRAPNPKHSSTDFYRRRFSDDTL